MKILELNWRKKMMKKIKNNYLFPLSVFVLILVIYLLKYNHVYNVSRSFLNLFNLVNIDKSVYINTVVESTLLMYGIFLLLYIIICLFFKKYSIKINFLKLKNKIDLNEILLKVRNGSSVIMLVISAVLLISNFNKIYLKNKSLNDIETIYYSKLSNADLTSQYEGDDYLINNDLYSFPKPEKIIKFDIDTLGNELPSSKDAGKINVIATINIDNHELKAYGTIKVQGSSTAFWPKKNWTLKLYNDETREETIKIRIGDSIFSDEWILKADWIDPTMLRNGLSYTLWDKIVDSREDNFLEVNNSSKSVIGAKGSPRNYTGTTNINGEHYGLATVLLGHDPDNFNIDNNNKNHLYFEFDARYGYTLVKTWEKFRGSGVGEWINFYNLENKDATKEQKNSIDKLGKFINSDIKTFKKEFDNHLDKTNMIDMLLFYEMVYDNDAIAQDIEIVTYDLEKFYFLPWDKDTTFGMWWEGNIIVEESLSKTLINYDKMNLEQMPWYKTYHAFTEDVEARYAQLRDKGVFSVNNLESMIESIYSKISDDLWDNEKSRWSNRPSVNETSKEQIIEWFTNRLELLDKVYNY